MFQTGNNTQSPRGVKYSELDLAMCHFGVDAEANAIATSGGKKALLTLYTLIHHSLCVPQPGWQPNLSCYQCTNISICSLTLTERNAIPN